MQAALQFLHGGPLVLCCSLMWLQQCAERLFSKHNSHRVSIDIMSQEAFMGMNVNAAPPYFYCANSLSNIHYLKSLLLFHQSKKIPKSFQHTHTQKKKNTYTVLWELCKIEEKRKKRKAIQITQRLNYQTRFVPLRAVQERAISIPKAGSHERGLMK